MAFDVIKPVKLGVAAITTSTSAVYTTPSLTRALVKNIDICNNNESITEVSVYLVPSGDSAGDSNCLLNSMKLKAKSTIQWFGTQVLNAGDSIQVVADKTGSTIHCSGGEAT